MKPAETATTATAVRSADRESAAAGPPIPALANAATFLATELVNYFSFLFRVPVFFCFAGMVVIIAIIIQDVYPGVAAITSAPASASAARHIHIGTGDWLKLYGGVSTAWYVLSLLARLVLRRRTFTVRYRTKFIIAAMVATLGWGFVLYNVPSLRVATGTSHAALALLFLFFYALTLGAFAAALALSRLADYISACGGSLARRLVPQGDAKSS
jgi:hypothetical protein